MLLNYVSLGTSGFELDIDESLVKLLSLSKRYFLILSKLRCLRIYCSRFA